MKTWICITLFFAFYLTSYNTAFGQEEASEFPPFQEEWVDTLKVELQPLMEISMQALEAKDIMITGYQYEEGTITTEFRDFDHKRITEISNADTARTDFEKCKYKIELKMTPLGQ